MIVEFKKGKPKCDKYLSIITSVLLILLYAALVLSHGLSLVQLGFSHLLGLFCRIIGFSFLGASSKVFIVAIFFLFNIILFPDGLSHTLSLLFLFLIFVATFTFSLPDGFLTHFLLFFLLLLRHSFVVIL